MKGEEHLYGATAVTPGYVSLAAEDEETPAFQRLQQQVAAIQRDLNNAKIEKVSPVHHPPLTQLTLSALATPAAPATGVSQVSQDTSSWFYPKVYR